MTDKEAKKVIEGMYLVARDNPEYAMEYGEALEKSMKALDVCIKLKNMLKNKKDDEKVLISLQKTAKDVNEILKEGADEQKNEYVK